VGADERRAPVLSGVLETARADFAALVPASVGVLRRGGLAALAASAIMVPAAALVLGGAVFLTDTPLLRNEPRLSLLLFSAAVVVGCTLASSGPLAAFGFAAVGRRPTVGETLARAFSRAPRIALLGLVNAAFSAITLLAAVIFGGCLAAFAAEAGFVVVAVALSLALATIYTRTFVVQAVAVMVDPHDYLVGIERARTLGEGHTPLLLVCALLPAAIPFIARPGELGVDAMQHAFGLGGVRQLTVVVAFAGAFLTLLAAAGLAASAYAVLIGSPDLENPTASDPG
jgi:hypothetical protein